jgi:hypothetical protein
MESYKKKILKLKCFSPLRILTSPIFEEALGDFLFLFLLFFSFSFFNMFSLFFSFFSMLRLLGFLMIFEKKIHFFKNFFPNKMVWS